MAAYLIGKNAGVSNVLSQSKAMDNGVITSEDMTQVSSEIRKLKGFTPDPYNCAAVKYDRFVIAIVGGQIGDRYFNAYLIRVPNVGWTFLELRPVPFPLHTPSR